MAANDYYHSNIPSPPSYEQANPGRTPDHAASPAPGLGYAAPSLANRDDSAAPYHNRESQQSFASEHPGYQTAGRVGEGDPYAENIPLKSQPPYGDNREWMNSQTQYPPSPGGLEDARRRGPPNGRRKKGFFSKKPAWVTWTLTLVQVIVFIVELVKAGELK